MGFGECYCNDTWETVVKKKKYWVSAGNSRAIVNNVETERLVMILNFTGYVRMDADILLHSAESCPKQDKHQRKSILVFQLIH